MAVGQIYFGFSRLIRARRQRERKVSRLIFWVDDAFEPKNRVSMLPGAGAQRLLRFIVENMWVPLAEPFEIPAGFGIVR